MARKPSDEEYIAIVLEASEEYRATMLDPEHVTEKLISLQNYQSDFAEYGGPLASTAEGVVCGHLNDCCDIEVPSYILTAVARALLRSMMALHKEVAPVRERQVRERLGIR